MHWLRRVSRDPRCLREQCGLLSMLGGEKTMRFAIILSVIVGCAVAVSPAAGQVAVAGIDSSVAPPPSSADTPPPPFPPMPHARPSHRCVNTCGGQAKTTHHVTAHHDTAKPRHKDKSTRHHASSTSHHRGKAHKESKTKTAARTPALHLSHSAIRRCHKETYGQLMSDSKCRALMSQELKAKEAHHRSARHKSSSKHEKKKASHATRHHAKRR